MSPVQSLHYAIGQMAYAVARADGEVQKAERLKFFNIVSAELRCNNYNFNTSSIIFQVMDKDQSSTEDSYHRAMNHIRLNSHYLSPALKTAFIKVMEKIAKAYPPVTIEESLLLDRFKKEIEPLVGDPAYYSRAEIKI